MRQITISVVPKACPNCGELIMPNDNKCHKCKCMLEWEYQPKLISDIVPKDVVKVATKTPSIYDVNWIFSEIDNKELILAYCADTLEPSDTLFIVEATKDGLAYIREAKRKNSKIKSKCYLVRVNSLTKLSEEDN